MESDAEKALIELAQSGDEQAYNSLFTLYRPRVYRIVRYILRDDADADDVVQDIFLKLFKALGSFRHESSFFTWIYKVAVNAARSSLSSRAREAHLLADSGSQVLEETYSSEADQPEIVHQRTEQVRMLDLAMTGLPPKLREPFLLRELDGLSYAEIAELMHCPVGTVRSRISRAKSFLAKRVAAPGESGS